MRSNVWCTNCSRQFTADLDLTLNGNHEITCPLCGHIHYRVVRDGVVTEERYQSSAGPTYVVTTSTTVTISGTWAASTGVILSNSWMNRSDITYT